MMIYWLEDAIGDLHSLHDYITQDNPDAANRMMQRLLAAVELLRDQPELGRPGRVSNTRELIVSGTPYLIPYRVNNNRLEILRVFHCARQWSEFPLVREAVVEVQT